MIMASVGGHSPATDADLCRFMSCVELAGLLWPKNITHNDVVNLDYGRDFLAEDKRYDVVILHSILHTNREQTLEHFRGIAVKSLARISPKHTIEAWARRLVSTRAYLIFVCEFLPCSLSGWNIGELPGYDIISRDHHITLYRRV